MSHVDLVPDENAPDFEIRARSAADEFAALADLAAPTDVDVADLVARAEAPLVIDEDDPDEVTDDGEPASPPDEPTEALDWPDRMRTHVGVPMESPQQRDRRTDARRGHTPPNLTAGMTIHMQERRVLTASGDVVEGGWDAYLMDEHRRVAKRRTTLESIRR